MTRLKVYGGESLRGEIIPQGAKNEALQVLCAVLLTEDTVTIHNIPTILDVQKLIELLKNLGVFVEKIENNSYRFTAKHVHLDYLDTPSFTELASSLRGSIMLLGPLLARFKKGKIPIPGGDKIGRRRLDTHFMGLESLGVKFDFDADKKIYNVFVKDLKGAYILLDEASVTGTANVIMASVLASGVTTIYNAACEPYIQQLCFMLNGMGGCISGIGSNLLTIKGVNALKGIEHTVLPDMIEIGSFIGMAAMTQSDIIMKDIDVSKLGIIPSVFQKLGIQMHITHNSIRILPQERYEIESFRDGSTLTLSDAPWPGLTPDLISVLLVTAIQAKGTVLIHQKMFESRLFFVDKLIDMGAQIILCDPHRATVIGLNREHSLRAISMNSPDIRAGISLLIAAMSAKGISYIHNADQIDRGYQNIEQRLNAIGAKIEKIAEK
ncbi:MAG: UDP-N-acetylglucosamine 1-carboxyvinyltransferase [Chitinophagaceae bacterium]|nr:UDP-N-acetylglucosamine 1-carboxyvinyltransferase [Chitinophagaceae bacterium]